MRKGRPEDKKTAQNWPTLLLSGVGVAAFTFVAPIIWQKVSHRSVGPDYVKAALRVEDGVLFLLVRNSSDDALDLVQADIEISVPTKVAFGAYPEPSHLYHIDSRSLAELEQGDGRLSVKLRIAQSVKSGHVDQFGFRINGPAGSLTPGVGSLSGNVTDIKGNIYPVKY